MNAFWYIEVFAYYVNSLVYLCHSLLQQQTKLVLRFGVNAVSDDVNIL